jgi:hypothetical protein
LLSGLGRLRIIWFSKFFMKELLIKGAVMTNTRSDFDESEGEAIELESKGRRKAVKIIVSGVTALAAYNVLPVNWGTPIIEQVFLPAHAATSGTCSDNAVLGAWHARGTNSTNYPEENFTLGNGGIVTDVVDGSGNPNQNGTWSKNEDVLTIVLPFVDGAVTGTTTYVLRLNSDCRTAAGTVNMAASNGQRASMPAVGNAV